MSILANLLKKNETNQAKGEIPPGVLQAVSGSQSSGRRQRYYLIGGVSLAAIAVGGLLGLYLNGRPAPRRPQVQPQPQPVRQQTVAIQKPLSSPKVAVSPQPATAVEKSAPAPTGPAKQASHSRSKSMQTSQGGKRSALAGHDAARPAVPERKAAPKNRSLIDAYLFAARNAEARRDYLTALKQYQNALDADPDNYRIMNNVASTMLQLGMYDEALATANRALTVKPEYVSAMVNAGIAHGNLGHGSAARGMFARAVTLDPGSRSALYNLALSQERAGTLDDALKSYRRLADGGDPQGYLGQGRLYERQGNNLEALKLYRELTALPEAGQRAKELARERIKLLDR